MRSLGWIAAASLLTGVWIGARNSALLGASREPRTSVGVGLPARYSAYDEMEALLAGWAAASPGEAMVHTLATSREGRPLRCLELRPAPEGPRGSGDRPWTVLLVGGLDGRSIASSLAVLRAGALLQERLPTLRRDVRILIVPAAAPDALADVRAGSDGRPAGRNRRPLDDDGDGAFGEDPPDDIDGDGLVLDMLLEDPRGPWSLEGTPPRLVPASEHAAVRYTRVREGRDDDGDGRFNEDAAGGVRYDEHFPVGWEGRPGCIRPLSEDVPRALADLAVSQEVDLALVFSGEHGGLRFFGDPASPPGDSTRRGSEAIGALFAKATGRACGTPRFGSFPAHPLSWLEESVGARAIEVAVWGPGVAGPRSAAGDDAPLEGREAWKRWVDEARGGSGFVDWHPIDIGRGRIALVGGFEPRTRLDPPEDLLLDALRGVDEFVLEAVTALPRLDIEVVEIARHGDCVELSARVVNRGGVPLDFVGEFKDAELTLEVGGGGEVLAGATRSPLPALVGHAATRRNSWLVRLPEGSPITLRARMGPGREVTREVRP